jgi:hypothetical protein
MNNGGTYLHEAMHERQPEAEVLEGVGLVAAFEKVPVGDMTIYSKATWVRINKTGQQTWLFEILMSP